MLLNEGNDFMSVEFQSNRVRDVFCLLMSRIKENKNQIVVGKESI